MVQLIIWIQKNCYKILLLRAGNKIIFNFNKNKNNLQIDSLDKKILINKIKLYLICIKRILKAMMKQRQKKINKYKWKR